MSTRNKVFIGLAVWFGLALILFAAFGSHGQNDAFQPQNEFKLDPWVKLDLGVVDMSINKAVLYLVLATILTCTTMVYIAKRMQDRPNRVQTAVETAYDLTRNQIVGQNMGKPMATKWFMFIATIFFFIWFSNMIGYIPLPTNTEHKVDLLGSGLKIPAFAIYAATANLSVPLVLTLVIWFSYHIEGVRDKGLFTYVKSFVPPGMGGFAAIPLFVIEIISDFVRIISLSVRLFANILAGHLLILFMAGGLVVLLGLPALGVISLGIAIPFTLFEIGLVATLQAFIFSILASIYLGAATSEAH